MMRLEMYKKKVDHLRTDMLYEIYSLEFAKKYNFVNGKKGV